MCAARRARVCKVNVVLHRRAHIPIKVATNTKKKAACIVYLHNENDAVTSVVVVRAHVATILCATLRICAPSICSAEMTKSERYLRI